MRKANDIVFVLSLLVALIFALPNLSLLRSTSTFDYILGKTQLPATLIFLVGGLFVICLQWLLSHLGWVFVARRLDQAEEEMAQLRAQLNRAQEDITRLREKEEKAAEEAEGEK